MFGRLRTKLTVLYAGLFALALALVAVLVYAAISTNAERAVRDELITSSAVFDRVRELRAGQLRESAEVLARDFGFREAAATGDAATIRSALDNLRGRSGADVGLMVRPDGTVIAGGGAAVGGAAPAIAAALEADERSQGILRIGDEVYQAISAPILSPTLSGWLVFAVRIDERELAELEKLSAIPLEAAVLRRGADGAWSGPGAVRGTAEERRTLGRHIDASLKAPRPETLRFADGRSVVLARPLQAMTPQSNAALVLRYPMARALQPYQTLMQTILGIGVLALIVVGVGSWLLARSVSRPLSALERAAQRLARGEEVEVQRAGDDEVGRLAGSFNAMALAIRQRERKIREDAEVLAVALDRAESANRATNDFLANMSHEIRTPLNGVLGLSRVLAQTTRDQAQKTMVEAIEASASNLDRLLGDILDAARLKAGKVEVRAEPFHLAEAARQTAELWRSSITEKGLDFDLAIAPEAEARVVGDSGRLQQILGNLLSNAVKFTEAGSVRLSVAAESAGFVFQVRDTGVGFTPEAKARLFQRFQQDDNSSTRRYGGSGLGLHISRSLAELMGGTLDGDGRPGDGAVFTLRLELPRAESGSARELQRTG